MKKFLFYPSILLIAFGLFFISGCEKSSPIQSGNEPVTELDQPYGGYTTANELPAFGDPILAADFADDSIVDDPVATDANFEALLDSQTVSAYFIRIVWGLLEMDSSATQIYEWSGSASVNKGVLGITRTIRFEPADHIIIPRPDPQTIAWTSQTGISFDGISLVILDTDSSETEGEFTFSTNLYSRTFAFCELDSLVLDETVNEAGQQISIVACKRDVVPFSGGFFAGRWLKDKEHGGTFFGRWMDRLGMNVGHLRGIWGENRQGRKVYFGKYILSDGEFGGLLSGQWGYRQNKLTEGWMEGRWVNRSLTKIGTMTGHWIIGEDETEMPHGFFHGQWKRTRPQPSIYR